MQLVTLVPTDPHVLQRLGAIYEDANDQSQAYQYKYESFRYCPTNIDVISWLGAYHMNSQYADKAIQYFEKAALIQPTQINWHLMVASCHRKIGQGGGSRRLGWMMGKLRRKICRRWGGWKMGRRWEGGRVEDG